jgi:hypothetical protein
MYNMSISLFGYKLNIISIIFVVVVIILLSHTYCGCHDPYLLIEGYKNDQQKKEPQKEGFAGANTNYGESSVYDLTNDTPIDTSSWMAPNMVVTPGQPLNPAVKAFLARPKQQIPLPEGQLDFLANTPFKSECCPNTYTNSKGCACMTGEQYNYLIQRGGNNVPYSEY